MLLKVASYADSAAAKADEVVLNADGDHNEQHGETRP